MNKEAFTAYYLPQIENQLKNLLTFPESPQEKLYAAARHVTLCRAKRLRPLLLLATVTALGGPIEWALSPACALEMLHTYSLIHDDLPCMDNDDYRRGQLTLHKKYDEATAVLTGDFLLTYPFQILAESPGLKDEQKLRMIQTLAIRAGGNGMIAGQLLDLETATESMTLERLKTIHRKKTGDLLIASLELGGIIANAPQNILEELQEFGSDIGLGFQIIDDVIDLTASVEKHGKMASSDAINGKMTYVSFLGVEGAKKAAEELLRTSINRLENIPNADLLKAIASSLIHRSG